MGNEPGSAVLALFDQLVDKIKQTRPKRLDGTPLSDSFVYSQLVLGMPVDPADYANPWSPMGGSTLQASLPAASPAPGGAAAPGGTAAPAGAADPAATAALKAQKAMQAAFKTAQLCNLMLQVTTDGSYQEYPTGRHLDFAYENVIKGMQPLPMPLISPDIQKKIDDAKTVLYELDDAGDITGKSKLYHTYVKNAAAYAKAKADYANALAEARANPVKAEVWPQESVTYQETVDEAYDSLKTEGAEKIELALATIESHGVCMQDQMIAKAHQLFEAWNLGLAGVPVAVPYSYISPTGWCDPANDDEGWQHLVVTSSSYQHRDSSRASMDRQASWRSDASSSGGSGGIALGFAAFGASGSSSSASGSWQDSTHQKFSSKFTNSAKNLTIDLEYGLCTIYRPWLVSDLFYMKHWYLVGNAKSSISDGTIEGQAGKDTPLLPMIPQQFLVIRNVKISSQEWGSDGDVLNTYYGADDGSSSADSSSEAATGGVCLGFVSFGGTASHGEQHASGQSSSWNASGSDRHFGATFDGTTLEIDGAQIIAFLSDIVPACPVEDDPGLAKKK